jgi:hypothetical protein
MEKRMRSHHLPDTDSIDALATFWDTHDLTDFEDELEEVTSPVFVRRRQTTVEIALTPGEAQSLKLVAEAKGVKERTLVRQWVRERLRNASFEKPPNKPLQPTAQKTRRG